MRAQRAFAIVAIAFAWPAVAKAQSDGDELSPGAQQIYDERYLTVKDELVYSEGAVYKVRGLYRGKLDQPLDEREFFEIVDRPEYASEIDRRIFIRWALVAGGGALVLGSAIELAVQFGKRPSPPACGGMNDIVPYDICMRNWEANKDGPNYFIPGFMFAGSLVLWGGAFLIDEHPVDGPGLKRMADDYNAKLRGLLALDPGTTSQRRTLRIEAAPYAGPGAGGVVLRGVF